MGKIYFASDFHLGIDVKFSSKEREKQIVAWLDEIKKDAEQLFLVGDLFDFYFEYKRVVPKGNVRFLGKLAELSDLGIQIHFFTGNHDMWLFDYFKEELNISTYREPLEIELKGKKFFIAHGDGLGPGDKAYKLWKKVFTNKLCQWFFARLHPNFGIALANYLSGSSRKSNIRESDFHDSEEWLLQYCNENLEKTEADYYIFGHRHLPIDYILKNGKSRYINLGDWMNYNSYASFDGESLDIKFYLNETPVIHRGG